MSRRHTPSLASAPRRGMTLLEAIIVLTMIAIIAGLALPKYDIVPSRADAAMRQVRGSLALAQRMAVQHQHDMVVSFDIPGRRIRVLEDSTNDDAANNGERAQWRSLDEGVEFLAPPVAAPDAAGGGPVVGAGVRPVDGWPSVIFRRNGSASGDLAVYVAAVRGPRRVFRAVTVLHTTGRTDWFRLRDATWVAGDL